jgi:hypothetical protein
MKKVFSPIAISLLWIVVHGQPTIQWQKSLGGSTNDYAYSIRQTSDGGYIIAGETNSNNGDVTGNHGMNDYWIVKLDPAGTIQWKKTLGGTSNDFGQSVQQTSDGGYIIAGKTDSYDGDVTTNHGNGDLWVVKLNSSGILQWQKSLGGSDGEFATSIQQTQDGGYIVAGISNSNNGDVTGHHGTNANPDYWVVKLDSSGTIQWQKSLGGSGDDRAFSIQQTSDAGYIVAGWTWSTDGDVTGHHGTYDYWIVKLDNSGTIQWQKCLGGTDYDIANSIQQTTDGGYIIGGVSSSSDGDVTVNHGYQDFWIVKLNSAGVIQWQKSVGGSMGEEAYSIQQTSDGGYITVGWSWSSDGDATTNHGYNDYWIVKLNAGGVLEWQKSLGGSSYDQANSLQQTSDGGFIIAGFSRSNDGDASGNHGGPDYWIVKLSAYIGIKEIGNNIFINIYPNPISSNSTITFTYPSTGEKKEIVINDVNGKEVVRYALPQWSTTQTVKLPQMAGGIYIARLAGENGSANVKFVVE